MQSVANGWVHLCFMRRKNYICNEQFQPLKFIYEIATMQKLNMTFNTTTRQFETQNMGGLRPIKLKVFFISFFS